MGNMRSRTVGLMSTGKDHGKNGIVQNMRIVEERWFGEGIMG